MPRKERSHVQASHFTTEFKAQFVLEILSGAKTAAEVCREHDSSPQVVNQWKAEFVQNAPKLFQGDARSHTDQVRIAELERLVGQLNDVTWRPELQ